MEDLLKEVGLPAVVSVLVPLVVAGVKWLLPRIPKPWLPIIAAVLGPAFDQALAHVMSIEATGWMAVLLGLAGVGLRELKVQLGKAFAGYGGTARTLVVVVALAAAAPMMAACQAMPGTAAAIDDPQTALRVRYAQIETAFRHVVEELTFLYQAGFLRGRDLETAGALVTEVDRALQAALESILLGEPADSMLDAAQRGIRQLILIRQHHEQVLRDSTKVD